MRAWLFIGFIILAVCSVAVLIIMRRELKREEQNEIRELEYKFNKRRKK